MNVSHEIIELSDGSPTAIPVNRQDAVQYSLSFTVQNVDGSANVYIGGAGVSTSSYGIKLVPGAIASFENVSRSATFFAITDSNGSEVAILQTSF